MMKAIGKDDRGIFQDSKMWPGIDGKDITLQLYKNDI